MENNNTSKDEILHIKELNLVIGKFNSVKAPGPDLAITELVKWMDDDAKHIGSK